MGKCYYFYLIYHLLLSTTLLGFLAVTLEPPAVKSCSHALHSYVLYRTTELIYRAVHK
jgi:hypothetical protein